MIPIPDPDPVTNSETFWVRQTLGEIKGALKQVLEKLENTATQIDMDRVHARLDELEQWKHTVTAEQGLRDRSSNRRLAVVTALGALLLVCVGILPVVFR